MIDPGPLQQLAPYLLALLLGALMGLERERQESRIAGLRTFTLTALLGCLCARLGPAPPEPWLLAAGLFAITVQAALMTFLRLHGNMRAGLTTAVALVIAYAIGALTAAGEPLTAVAITLAVTALLYFKPQMHAFSHRLQERDLTAILQFVLVAFIILPVLPDRSFGPYAALNPHNIWLMVVLISAINLTAYVTLKLVGRRWGGPVLGILGGLVSSTATTLSFSRHARSAPAFSATGALVVALASSVVLVRLALLLSVLHPALLGALALPLGGMFMGGLIPAFFLWRNGGRDDSPAPEPRNPAELPQALFFGLLYALVLLAVSAAKEFFGTQGVYGVALISGLTDVDAITLSNARLAATGVLVTHQAAVSILLAILANLAFKLGLVFFLGTRPMFRRTLLCFTGLALPSLLILL